MLQQRLEIMRHERTNRSELQNELAETRSLTIDLPADRETSRGKWIFRLAKFFPEQLKEEEGPSPHPNWLPLKLSVFQKFLRYFSKFLRFSLSLFHVKYLLDWNSFFLILDLILIGSKVYN